MLEHIRNISALETEISDAGQMRWVSKLGLVKILNFKFCGDADVWLRFLVDA